MSAIFTHEKYEHMGLTIEICNDPDAQSPREDFDNLGKLWLSSNGNWMPVDDMGFDEYVDDISKFYPNGEVFLVYYVNGIFTLSPGYHSNSQAGFIGCSAEDIRREFSCKRITKEIRRKVHKIFMSELSEYSAWCNGDCYSYVIYDIDGEHLDGCGGYIGNMDAAKESAELAVADLIKNMPDINERKTQLQIQEDIAQLERAGQRRLSLEYAVTEVKVTIEYILKFDKAADHITAQDVALSVQPADPMEPYQIQSWEVIGEGVRLERP